MKSYLFPATLVLTAVTVFADPKADVADAIKKLEGQPGYSWTTTPKTEGSQAGRNQGPIDGKAEKGGLTYFKGMRDESAFEVAMLGEKVIVNFTGDWLTPVELGAEAQVTRFKRNLRRAGDEAQTLIARLADLKKDGDGAFSGELKPEAAKELFALIGRRAAEAEGAKGTARFWLKDGQLARYEYTVGGKISVGGDTKREVDISRTISVEIKDVGTTKITLPEEARKKLS